MDRRDSLKSLAVGTLSVGLLLDACNASTNKEEAKKNVKNSKDMSAVWAGRFEDWETSSGRMEWERARDKGLMTKTFFNKHEMDTIAVLSDIIIPEDSRSGSATDAGVPDFIEFIVKDIPEHQLPMRGGLQWLDQRMRKRYSKSFVDCTKKQQLTLIDEIAWPSMAKREMRPGVLFFSLMRNLTASGFFTSKIGIKDLGYKGNTPNVWDGVPEDVLKQYEMSYSDRQLSECVKKEDHNKIFLFHPS